MRFLLTIILIIGLSGCAINKNAVPTSEEAKLQEAEQLVRVSLTDRLLENLKQRGIEQYSAFLVSKEVPEDMANKVVQEVIEPVASEEQQDLVDYLVEIYRRYYTAAEIHQLLSFYQTDVARKSMTVSNQIATESQQYVRNWNSNFEELVIGQVTERLKAEGIDLEL